MKQLEFYYCKTCQNLVLKLKDGGADIICCGEPMTLLSAQTADKTTEKHVPLVERNGNQVVVTVGSTLHPMLENHYIEWIAVQQGDKVQIANLKPNDEPKATFLVDEGPVIAFEHCNLHGLWQGEE